ncbi:LapA family protein [Accumulibacter sp.]|uniref:LapA family protein n=1 Tax=Accumulibacter sp. TaxID=2053492 RepID=UPI0025DA821D|nr:LapA family protein [Accumulibacter sp.]MCM8594616.1 LapA family protein [Accumulibacter sp.]MCM8627253.1 LapA family protein [Accumulibacter sp.]MDS4048762.1 LapA family protein [Accumulibacter sp.]
MKLRTLSLLLVLGALAAFAALNWSSFVSPTTLSLGLAEVQAPLGLIMLGMVAVLTAIFLVFVVYVQASALFDSRRHAQELQANRELADKAEASRFTELRGFLESELAKIAERCGTASPAVDPALLARLDRLEAALLTAVEQSGNGLAASIGELEDRLEREGGLPTLRP